jgi:acyl dehydratase
MQELLSKPLVTFTKTVGESDVYLFAGITGDFSPNHVDEQAMRRTPYGRRIAHGALMIGYMSTASTRAIEQGLEMGKQASPVSLGYDRVRFLKAVFFGDTITVRYILTSIDEARMARRRTWRSTTKQANWSRLQPTS